MKPGDIIVFRGSPWVHGVIKNVDVRNFVMIHSRIAVLITPWLTTWTHLVFVDGIELVIDDAYVDHRKHPEDE